ncbi:hypothetical protein [Couchioplanes caeruleus]|uniref:Uncharacterized protein n=2 Tax=Couchioplanes caeruleus TaxID=56438 RepID=A0A1K0FLU7_9ACTN|nr:hypothetical protein [Couchioplanes caeruleus]OJF13704.1 hypothetical protein BG844_13630 [Couchioplanes caeruleus subsp. caeruleus]ROP32482.1 hypothetical protein EDD30_5425 [Couchioplanes caeruleus]
MPRLTDGFTTRRFLAAGLTAVVLTAASPAAAIAAPTRTLPTSTMVLAATEYEQKMALAIKFGLGGRLDLIELVDRDFVIAIWTHVKDKPQNAEVRVAAELAFSATPQDVEQACADFILTEAQAALDRERERRSAEEKRRSDLARSTAAAAINVTADAALLDGTDAKFVELIWQRVVEDSQWPKVKAAAAVALQGTAGQQQAFIASGLAEAARQDTKDRIAKDEAQTGAAKAAALVRAAKRFAANRIGLPVTDELLNLPDRDFIVTVWNHEAGGTKVQDAAVEASRSLDPAIWKTFIDTGIHQAKDRDIQAALDKKEAEDRTAVRAIVDRAVKPVMQAWQQPGASRWRATRTPSPPSAGPGSTRSDRT